MSAVQEKGSAKRADARKNVEAILDAATECLARDPDVSIREIAKAAGVGRVTLYGHFDSRAALVADVVERVMAQSESVLGAVDTTGDAEDALARLLDATWEVTHRYGALVVAAEQVLPAEQLRQAHHEPMLRVQQLIRRGRRQGSFRKDMPVTWQLSTIQAIVHGASAAVHRGEVTAAQAPALIRGTVLAALAPPAVTPGR
jgi:TetR/AcrR family transcriptional regulator, mexCD-oprJ operon repressor